PNPISRSSCASARRSATSTSRSDRAPPRHPDTTKERSPMITLPGPLRALLRNPLRLSTPAAEPVVLSADDVAEIGRELDAMRAEVIDSLGDADRDYLYSVLDIQRRCEIAGRAMMYAPFLPPVWLAGVGALSMSKILDNMEIGHNVMHGQYDWMREDAL